MSSKVIELNDIKRINYNDYVDTTEDSSFRILEWENGEWRKYVRDYMGTRWYGPYPPDREAVKNIHYVLEDEAKKIGVGLKGYNGDIRFVNVRKLVESVATMVDVKTEGKLRVETYKSKDGKIINLVEKPIY